MAIIAIAFLTGCTPSKNDVACSTFETQYNELADAVRRGGSAESVSRSADKLIVGIDLALDSASGVVSTALRESLDASSELEQAGVQPVRFFDSAQAVSSACAASGSGIELHSLVE